MFGSDGIYQREYLGLSNEVSLFLTPPLFSSNTKVVCDPQYHKTACNHLEAFSENTRCKGLLLAGRHLRGTRRRGPLTGGLWLSSQRGVHLVDKT